jgi:hypothetical protein
VYQVEMRRWLSLPKSVPLKIKVIGKWLSFFPSASSSARHRMSYRESLKDVSMPINAKSAWLEKNVKAAQRRA